MSLYYALGCSQCKQRIHFFQQSFSGPRPMESPDAVGAFLHAHAAHEGLIVLTEGTAAYEGYDDVGPDEDESG